MRATILALWLIFSPMLLRAQRTPIPDLPAIDWEEAGFNTDSVEGLIPFIDGFEERDFRGLVVIKDHQIVMEWYYNTFMRMSILDIRSAGKSITSLILGVAMQEGLVESLDQDVYSFFPTEKYPSMDKGYKKIKLRHLLDMSSGLDADSDDWETPGNAGQWIARDEWVEYMLSVPIVDEPGRKWIYADINAVLIGAIIEEASGMSLRDFAKEKVFDPLGISQVYWYTNKAAQTGAAGNLYLSTLDFAKLGVLVANQGQWAGNQIVQPDYVHQLLRREAFDLSDTRSYGMLWYKSVHRHGQEEIEFLYASGNGGNYLVVVPDHDLVIALTSSAYGTGYGHQRVGDIIRRLLNALE